jgi:hypothetical protein
MSGVLMMAVRHYSADLFLGMSGVLMMAVRLLATISSAPSSLALPPAPSPHIHCKNITQHT